MLWAGPPGYSTPVFNASDPLICHSLQLRPSLWAVVFDTLQRLGEPYAWIQDDLAAATPGEVAQEIVKATDAAVFAGCSMLGDIRMIARDVAAWELVCDGATYNRVDYPDLYAVLDAAYILDADTFRVPDLMDRFPLGALIVAQSGGASSHTLTEAEIPSHNHVVSDADITGLFVSPGEVPAVINTTVSVSGNTGGGQAHNNMPPYETVLFVILARWPNG